jgi:2-amino-4-hydroxy-6-hydroxymethyldihydropteridine diphosphokinase
VSNVPNPNVVDADTLTGDLRPLRRAAFALGSNLGERLDFLQGAVDALTDSPEIVPVAVSPVYETEPVGGPPGQPTFLNAVLVVDTTLSPRSMLERAMATETAYGRTRDEPDGSRTLDVDVLAVGIDAEPNEPLPAEVVDLVLRPEERAGIRRLEGRDPAVGWGRLWFSAKESVYKAWYPLTRRWLGFDAVSVELQRATAGSGTFTARVSQPGPGRASDPGELHGRWIHRGRYLLTAVLLDAPGKPDGAVNL